MLVALQHHCQLGQPHCPNWQPLHDWGGLRLGLILATGLGQGRGIYDARIACAFPFNHKIVDTTLPILSYAMLGPCPLGLETVKLRLL